MRLSVFPLAVLHDERLLAHVRSELCMLMCGVLCLDASVTIAVVRRVYGVYACSSEKRPPSRSMCVAFRVQDSSGKISYSSSGTMSTMWKLMVGLADA